MSDPIGRWCFVEILLLLGSALFTLLGTAFDMASESRLRNLMEAGDKRAARALPLVQEPKHFIAAMRMGAVCVGFFAVYNDMTRTLFARIAGTSSWTGVILVLLWLAASLIAVSLCLLAPCRIASCRAERIARSMYAPARVLETVCRPLLAAAWGLSTAVVRLLGVKPGDEAEKVSEDEILLMVDAGEESGAIEKTEKEMIENVFAFNNTSAEDIMVHRTDMVVIWEEDTDDQIFETIRESGLSRFPVCGEDVDDVIGVLSTRDFLINREGKEPKRLRQLLRSPYFVPESVKIDVLFRDMQTGKVHMAVVVDEYGGTSGLVTMEDLLEQLVGEIYDEFDAEEEQEITKLSDDTWRVAGCALMEEVAEALDLQLSEEDEDEYETLGGLIFSKLSVIPEDGANPEVDVPSLGLHIRVDAIRDRRVEWATVTRISCHEDTAEEE